MLACRGRRGVGGWEGRNCGGQGKGAVLGGVVQFRRRECLMMVRGNQVAQGMVMSGGEA